MLFKVLIMEMLEKLKKYFDTKTLPELQKEWDELKSHKYEGGLSANDLLQKWKDEEEGNN